MISIIVAIAKNGIIGYKGGLVWNLPDDLKHFAKITKGHTVIMGRKTYESIVGRLGHALPDRKNIVISRGNIKAPDCTVTKSVDEIVKMFSNSEEEVFVIGGGEIYKQFLPTTNKLYITDVDVWYSGDTFFPTYEKEDWKLISSEHHNRDEKHAHDFTFLEFVRK
jgi:dihydrofolate reductase